MKPIWKPKLRRNAVSWRGTRNVWQPYKQSGKRLGNIRVSVKRFPYRKILEKWGEGLGKLHVSSPNLIYFGIVYNKFSKFRGTGTWNHTSLTETLNMLYMYWLFVVKWWSIASVAWCHQPNHYCSIHMVVISQEMLKTSLRMCFKMFWFWMS